MSQSPHRHHVIDYIELSATDLEAAVAFYSLLFSRSATTLWISEYLCLFSTASFSSELSSLRSGSMRFNMSL